MAEEFPGIRFEEAIAFLRERLALPEEIWQALVAEADRAARTRAAGMSAAMNRDILEAVLKALEEGQTLAQFEEAFETIARAHGWAGDQWRAELIFRTQIAQAQAAGRWRQIERLKVSRPWLRYLTAGDHRVRPAHAAWHNVILRHDDPWWETHFPPNGFNCRCHVQQLSDRDLARYGLTPSPAAPPLNPVIKFVKIDGVLTPVEVPAGIDPGFAYNPGRIGLDLPPEAARPLGR